MIRNLICHIYPRSAGGHWRRTVERLLQHWNQFDGGKVVSIAVDDTTEPAEAVQEAFGKPDIDYIVGRNIPGLQETAFFLPALERVIDLPGVTLRLHAKGATHRDPGSASHTWREALLTTLLDYPALVDAALADFPTVGSFRSVLPFGVGSLPCPWHWAGSMYYLDNETLRRRPWRRIEGTFFGIESYPGQQFALEESGCLFWPHASTAHLYDPEYWRRWITPALNRWKARLSECTGREAA